MPLPSNKENYNDYIVPDYNISMTPYQQPKAKEPKLEKRKRIGRFGEVFIEKRLILDAIIFPSEPTWPSKKPACPFVNKEEKVGLSSKGGDLVNGSTADVSQEYYYKHYQDNYFGDIYAFSDGDDTIEDLDKRFKPLGQGFKTFNKQKKRQTTDKQTNSLTES